MGLRKHYGSYTSPVLANVRAARTAALILVVIGGIGAVLELSAAVALFFILAGAGTMCLSIANRTIHWVALGLFGIDLVSFGIGLCPLPR